MVLTRAGALAAAFEEQFAEQDRQSRVIALDGLVCRVVQEPPRGRSPRRRFRSGALAPQAELSGETAAPGSYIRRYLAHALSERAGHRGNPSPALRPSSQQ